MDELNIERDEMVYTADGMEAGRVKHVIVDRARQQLTDLVIERDGEEVLVPIGEVERGAQHALMLRTATAGGGGTRFVRDQYHEVDEEEITGMSVGTRAGGDVVERADDDRVVVDDAAPRRTERVAGRAAETADHITVPVVEEQLKAGVRDVEAGRFRLAKTVTQEEQTINVPVEREEVYVTERAVNRRPATPEDLAMREREIEIPLREQEVVTSKEARVTGEVEVRKETVADTERVTDTVRREEVHVEDPNNPRVHVEGGGLVGDQRARYDAMSPNIRARYGALTEEQRAEYDRRYPLRRDNGGSILDPDGDGENAFEELGRNITEGTDRPGNRNR